LRLLFYARKDFEQKLHDELHKAEPDPAAVQELEALVNFVGEHFHAEIKRLEELPDGSIEFENLRTLFRPFSLLYAEDELGQGRAYRVRQSEYLTLRDGTHVFCIKADYVDTNGRRLATSE
jgi:hypothetical protein